MIVECEQCKVRIAAGTLTCSYKCFNCGYESTWDTTLTPQVELKAKKLKDYMKDKYKERPNERKDEIVSDSIRTDS